MIKTHIHVRGWVTESLSQKVWGHFRDPFINETPINERKLSGVREGVGSVV